jgi:hypothetical protein
MAAPFPIRYDGYSQKVPLRGFDYFDTAVAVCGKVKDADEKITGGKRKTHLFKNQTRKGRPPGKDSQNPLSR